LSVFHDGKPSSFWFNGIKVEMKYPRLQIVSMEVEMSAKKLWKHKTLAVLALSVIVVLIGSMVAVKTVRATPGSGITPETLASGNLADPISAKFKTDFGNVHANVSKTTLIKYTIVPGGVFGWHQHGGPLWVMVVSGSLSFYDGDDPSCTGKVYPAGTTFMDPGDHTHNARNEGSVDLVIYVVFMLPEDGAPRIDAPNPGNCPF
jgi:mannose-6-phosphate isomerase-like protein (cupin superfamily)